jgi:hypothetical protein
MGEGREGESRKGKPLSLHDLKLAALQRVAFPLLYPPPKTGEEA